MKVGKSAVPLQEECQDLCPFAIDIVQVTNNRQYLYSASESA